MEEQKIIEKFKRVKNIQYTATIPIVILSILSIFVAEKDNFEFMGISNDYLIVIIFSIFVVYFIFSVVNWRCPNCKHHLGKGLDPNFCKNCGKKLK